MDKYQKYLLSEYGDSLISVFSRACPIELEQQGSKTRYLYCDENNTFLTINHK